MFASLLQMKLMIDKKKYVSPVLKYFVTEGLSSRKEYVIPGSKLAPERVAHNEKRGTTSTSGRYSLNLSPVTFSTLFRFRMSQFIQFRFKFLVFNSFARSAHRMYSFRVTDPVKFIKGGNAASI